MEFLLRIGPDEVGLCYIVTQLSRSFHQDSSIFYLSFFLGGKSGLNLKAAMTEDTEEHQGISPHLWAIEGRKLIWMARY
jgi:hypothetical protein